MSAIISWGDNANGQLGDGGDIGRSVPNAITTLSRFAPVKTVEAGSGHVVALLDDATAVAWGRNAFGQIGDGSTENQSLPRPVHGLSDIIGVAAGGGQTLFLREDRTLWGCGAGFFGVLGANNVSVHPVPVPVDGIRDVRKVVAGGGHTLALLEDGSVWTWGRDDCGQLGDGAATQERSGRKVAEHDGKGYQIRMVPAKVEGLPEIRDIAAGGGHSMAITTDNRLMTWGLNDLGQLGDGTNTQSAVPVEVEGLHGVRAAAAGYHHTLALTNDGSVWAFGLNDLGQLGDGTTTHRSSPVRVEGLPAVRAIAARGGGSDIEPGNHGHSYAIHEDGTVSSWGCNGHGELGDGTTTHRSSPQEVKGLEGVNHITAGGEVPAFRENPGGGYGLALSQP